MPTTVKKLPSGTSFFDRVKLPRSYGMKRVEMVDAWTQTSDREDDKKEEKDQTESGVGISPT